MSYKVEFETLPSLWFITIVTIHLSCCGDKKKDCKITPYPRYHTNMHTLIIFWKTNVYQIKIQSPWIYVCKKHLFFLSLFIDFERECAHKQGKGRERGRENPKQAPLCQLKAQHEAPSHDLWEHELSWNQESDAQQPESPRCPDISISSWSRYSV